MRVVGDAAQRAISAVSCLTLACSVLLLVACVHGLEKPAALRPQPAGGKVWRPPLQPFRADLRGRFRGERGKGRFRAGLGARPPDFRLDLFHPVTGQTLLSLGLLNGQLRAIWPGEGLCLEAKASPRLMEDLLEIRIEPEDLLPLLSGRLYPDARVQILRIQAADGSWEPIHGDLPHRRRVTVEGLAPGTGVRYRAALLSSRQGLALGGVRVAADGSEIHVRYSGWVRGEVAAPAHPGEVHLGIPRRQISLHLKIKGWAAGGPPEAALWPVLPPGCRQIDQGDLEKGRAPGLFSQGAGR